MFMTTKLRKNQGFSLIEVLVSSFVLSVGLLGVASMQWTSMKMNQGAYYQSQATVMINDMLDRIRLNRDSYLAGDYDDADTSGTVPSAQSCTVATSGCTGSQQALQDIREFAGYLNDIDGLGDDFIPIIPGGVATITRAGTTNLATVTVIWEQDLWSKVAGVILRDTVTQQVSVTVRI